ncbi:MAG: class B sortase [Clostridia bacterium]|nr:class B sortase [Clostridia bacterium]
MKNRIRTALCLLLALTLMLLCACRREPPDAPTETTAVTQLPDATTAAGAAYPDPVDFAEYQSVNREAYAYIRVPGTNIDYPIVQSGISDSYYLRRTWQGQSSYRGCIFTQSVNAKEFTDPVTVVYGHNTDKGDMFSELLNFQDPAFFEAHDLFYIFIPGHILVYQVISAHTFDDRHIMNAYDFSDAKVLAEFQQMLLDPAALERNVRSGVTLDANSEIVVLSTCAEPRSGGSARYLVNGVLINDVVTV